MKWNTLHPAFDLHSSHTSQSPSGGHAFPPVHSNIEWFHSVWQPIHNLRQCREEQRKYVMGALMLKLCAMFFLNNLQWQGRHIVDTNLWHLIIHWLAVASVGTNWEDREICCVRETGYYLDREEAIGNVWGKGDEIRKRCVTWATLVLRLVQTDLYGTVLWWVLG